MFKKSLIAVAVLGATAFSVQAADVTMYGKVDTGLLFKSNEITEGSQAKGSSSKTPVAKPDGTKMFCSAFLNDARMCCFFFNTIVKY